MKTPLSSDWVPNRDLFSESSDWVTNKEPTWLRIAPIVAITILVALTLWARRTEIDSPTPMAVSVLSQKRIEAGWELTLVSPLRDTGPPRGSHRALLQVQGPSSGYTRIGGIVKMLDAASSSSVLRLSMFTADALVDCSGKAGVLYMMTDRTTVADMILGLIKRRGGGSNAGSQSE
jgi:hypothetical protein